MKKVITIILCFALLCSMLPARAFDESIFYGAWARSYEKDNGGLTMEFFYLTADHKVFYVNRSFDAESEGSGRAFVGSWDTIDDGIHIIYGSSAETDAYITKNGFLAIPLGEKYIPYGKIPVYGEEKEQEKPEGAITIFQGEYDVPADIPAGKYVVDAGDASRITIWVYDAKGWSNYYYIGANQNEQYMVVKLEDGGKLRIDGASVTLSPFAGFN